MSVCLNVNERERERETETETETERGCADPCTHSCAWVGGCGSVRAR